MSGHSKWSKIKRQKGAADKKKGVVFSKLARSITIAAKNGGDPEYNYKLRLEIDRAKEAGMPADNVQRAIKKGTGEDMEGQLDEITYEGFGPSGIAIIIQTATDNRNRTTSSVRHILSKYGGSLGQNGSVSYLFEPKGQILVSAEKNKNLSEVSLEAIDMGAEDVSISEDGLEILTSPSELHQIKSNFDKKGIQIENYEVIMKPINQAEPDDRTQSQLEKLLEELEDDEDVISVHTNTSI